VHPRQLQVSSPNPNNARTPCNFLHPHDARDERAKAVGLRRCSAFHHALQSVYESKHSADCMQNCLVVTIEYTEQAITSYGAFFVKILGLCQP
jgi:hypothetical protein